MRNELFEVFGPSKLINILNPLGLTLDESIACVKRGEDKHDIVVPLVTVTVWKTSGVTILPASRDLKCVLNDEEINGEANLIPGQSHFRIRIFICCRPTTAIHVHIFFYSFRIS